MFSSEVTDPNGNEWLVTLQIIPNREGIGLYQRFVGRLAKRRKERRQTISKPEKMHWYDYLDFPYFNSLDDFWIVLGIIAAIIIFVFVGWPLLLLLADFIWLILILLGAVVSFVILGRPITITANNEDWIYTYKVRGIFKARKRMQEIERIISKGNFNKLERI